MRIALMSDSHCQHPKLPEADLLIHAGDLCSRGTPGEFDIEIDALAALRPKYPKGILYVPGNHDKCLDEDFIEKVFSNWKKDPYHSFPPQLNMRERDRLLRRFADAGVTVMVDDAIEIDGIKFYGSPYTPTFYDWAFMESEINLSIRWQNIPTDTQFLITHGPPKYTLDLCRNGNVGSDSLARVLSNLPDLRAHVFGHIHEGAGYKVVGSTTFINASVLDGRYIGFNPIHVLETDSWQIVQRLEDHSF